MILTVEQLREHVTTTLGDDALQRLLDAAEELIISYVGPGASTYEEPEAIDELITVHGDLLMIGRPAQAIDTVIEGTTTLDPSDYELRSSGTQVRRLRTGTNPSWRWHGRVDITYIPLTDSARREVAQIELVKLDISFDPLLVSETIGAWSESYQQGQKSADEWRDEILSTLSPSFAGMAF